MVTRCSVSYDLDGRVRVVVGRGLVGVHLGIEVPIVVRRALLALAPRVQPLAVLSRAGAAPAPREPVALSVGDVQRVAGRCAGVNALRPCEKAVPALVAPVLPMNKRTVALLAAPITNRAGRRRSIERAPRQWMPGIIKIENQIKIKLLECNFL